jgi:hypothetical protein
MAACQGRLHGRTGIRGPGWQEGARDKRIGRRAGGRAPARDAAGCGHRRIGLLLALCRCHPPLSAAPGARKHRRRDRELLPRRAGRGTGRAPRPLPHPVLRDRLPLVHRCDPGSPRRAKTASSRRCSSGAVCSSSGCSSRPQLRPGRCSRPSSTRASPYRGRTRSCSPVRSPSRSCSSSASALPPSSCSSSPPSGWAQASCHGGSSLPATSAGLVFLFTVTYVELLCSSFRPG